MKIWFGLVLTACACGGEFEAEQAAPAQVGGAAGVGGMGGAGGAGGEAEHAGGASRAGAAGLAEDAGQEAASPCPIGMVFVEPGFCIDVTEVTNAEYDEFLATEPAPLSACSWNTDFAPGEPDVCLNANPPDAPVVCVDWCDAAAYCTWAGKKLCGKIGGGPSPVEAFDDADQNQWFAACSGGLLIGSVWEWEDSCENDAVDGFCRLRLPSNCGGSKGQPRNYSVGSIRCCS